MSVNNPSVNVLAPSDKFTAICDMVRGLALFVLEAIIVFSMFRRVIVGKDDTGIEYLILCYLFCRAQGNDNNGGQDRN